MKKITVILISLFVFCQGLNAQQETPYNREIQLTDALFMVAQDKLWGLVHVDKGVLVPIEHSMIFIQENKLLGFREKDKCIWNFYDTNGQQVNSFPFNHVLPLKGDYFRYQVGEKWGLMDIHFQIKKAALYEEIRIFQDSFLRVKKEGRYGLWSLEGEELLPCQYGGFGWIYPEVIMTIGNRKWGLIQWDGTVLFEPQFEHFYRFEYGKARVCREGKWGILSDKGEIIVPFKYDFVQAFRNGLLEVELNEKVTMVNEEGKEINPPVYDRIGYRRFKERLIDVQKDGKWGLIDTEANVILKPRYYAISNFDEGKAVVFLQQEDELKAGLIDTKGKVIIPFEYHRIEKTLYNLSFREPIKQSIGYMCWGEDGARLYDPQGKCLSCQ
jgi:hypothetical protein